MKFLNKIKAFIKDLLSGSIKSFNIEMKNHDLIINISNPNKVALINDNIMYKQSFYFSTASFSKNKIKKEDFGIIERFNKIPRKVVFQSELDKRNIMQFNDQFQKDGKDLIYIVDVEIIKIESIVKIYKIVKIYYDEVLNLEEL